MSFASPPSDIALHFVGSDRLKKPEIKPPFARPQPPKPNPVAQLGQGKPAARITDKFAHSSALASMFKFIAIAVTAVVVAAVATALIVGTGGLAAGPMLMMVGGGLAAVGGAGLAGISAGSKKMGPPTGAILIPTVNTNVFSNSLLNACATSSQGACAKDPGPPIPVAVGSDSVFIHNLGAAREGDKMACGAAIIAACSPDVLIGGNAKPYMDIQSEVPEWVVNTLKVMAIGGLIMTGAGAITVIGAAFVGGGMTAGVIATGEMALTIGGGMALQEGGKYAGGQIALAQGHDKDSYEYEAYRFYGETLTGVAFDVGSAKAMDSASYKGAVESINAKAADPNTKLGQVEAAANAKGRAMKKGMAGATAGAMMNANIMMTNLSPPIPKAPTHFEAPATPVKNTIDIAPKTSSGGGDKSVDAEISRVNYETETGVFTAKGVETTSGPVPPKPTITTHIEAAHPSHLIRKNDFDSVKTPKADDGGGGTKPKKEIEAENKIKADEAAAGKDKKSKPKTRTDIINERIKTDPKVARDIKADEGAVYGYSPKSDGSLGALKTVDYADPKQVAKARKVRSHYKTENGRLDAEIAARKKEILDNGGDYDSPEMRQLAEDAVNGRNRIRTESNELTGTLDKMHKRNVELYGRKEGPTLEYYLTSTDNRKSIHEILGSSTKSNKGADVVLGLWP